ncbi:MAG: orotidine-5'-phosphate decarboxylase [Halothiobacillaceae bacterium]|nr:MAG: orotidine-5'-phosphate decarboxylase [Halothiobacillaceae bacterium]
MTTTSKIIIALDYAHEKEALALTARLNPAQCRLKVGKELFTRSGTALVERLLRQGFEIFLDLKFHDIPNTVAGACRAAADMGVWMVNVHALGGRRMMEAAREALAHSPTPPHLIAVTVLTSMEQHDLYEIGLAGEPIDNVVRLARLAHTAGLDGVVCSPQEAAPLRQALGNHFLLVTPGVRPLGAMQGDQKRTLTPSEALRAGANYLVIGRPITAADDPIQALLTIEREIASIT